MTAEQKWEPGAASWLPRHKRAAVVFSVDDVHPAGASAPYEAGGALGRGALGRLERLLEAHPRLRVTLFVTPDWRPISVLPTRKLLGCTPLLRSRAMLAPTWKRSAMRLDRHPDFVAYLRSLPRSEVAAHGLHHAHPGPRVTVEFQRQSRATCAAMLRRARGIFEDAGLPLCPGFQPPGWQAPPNLIAALGEAGFAFLSSARDLDTPVAPEARCAGSGLQGVPMLRPAWLQPGGPLHLPVNFQATSRRERAFEIVEAGGLISIKAHVAKHMLGHVMRDGLDDAYVADLDALFGELEQRYGDALWWTSMDEIHARLAPARTNMDAA